MSDVKSYALTRWELLTEWERDLLVATPLGVSCFYCNTPLPTEADHARHFRLADPVSVAMGYCPNAGKRF
ncbi:hypothetical protein ABT115_08860 [Streptomyces sp. NPDC001832]|uniref:hypothetical protein n=1 Tax=Streptomyces sp. NPDC001832 TaxID=3154527 RepID=UPI00331FDF64